MQLLWSETSITTGEGRIVDNVPACEVVSSTIRSTAAAMSMDSTAHQDIGIATR